VAHPARAAAALPELIARIRPNPMARTGRRGYRAAARFAYISARQLLGFL
jgi:hypothetical protein